MPRLTTPADAPIRFNLGCGPVQPAGWVNVDGSNRAWLASKLPWLDKALVAARLLPPTEFNSATTFANLGRPFPWPEASAEAFYLGEILEHFTRNQGRRLLESCYRILKPGGILRVRVPDNARFWGNYVEQYHKIRSRPRADWSLDHSKWIEMFFHDICVRPGLLRSNGHYHKYMYDDIILIKLMEDVGFQDVERMSFLESRLDDVANVEVRDDLIVEGIKPNRVLTPVL